MSAGSVKRVMREAPRAAEAGHSGAGSGEPPRPASGQAAEPTRRTPLTARQQRAHERRLRVPEREAGVDGTSSAIFVATYLDLNNLEAGDPIAYARTTLVDSAASGPAGRFLDKPWTAVDIPRAGAATCTFDIPQDDGTFLHQQFPGGRMYVAYTAFSGSGASLTAKILFSHSSDCAETWSPPRDISALPDPDINDDGTVNGVDLDLVRASFNRRCGESRYSAAADINQDCVVNLLDLAFVSRHFGQAAVRHSACRKGATIAIHPLTGEVYVAWREFKAGGQPDVIQFAKSADAGATFTPPATIAAFSPFDQGTTDTSFRSNAYPTMAADTERIYVAWAARGFATTRTSATTGDARIVLTTSRNGGVVERSAPGR